MAGAAGALDAADALAAPMPGEASAPGLPPVVNDGKPVTIRLLDPPLHEFVPQHEEKQAELAAALPQSGIEPLAEYFNFQVAQREGRSAKRLEESARPPAPPA